MKYWLTITLLHFCLVLHLAQVGKSGEVRDGDLSPFLWNITDVWKRGKKEIYIIISDENGQQSRREIQWKEEKLFCQAPVVWMNKSTIDNIPKSGERLPSVQVQYMDVVYKFKVLERMIKITKELQLVTSTTPLSFSKQNMVLLKVNNKLLVTWRERNSVRKDQTGTMWLNCKKFTNRTCDVLSSAQRQQKFGAEGRVMLYTPPKKDIKVQVDVPLYGEDMRILRMSDGSLYANWCVNRGPGFIKLLYTRLNIEKKGNYFDVVAEIPLKMISIEHDIPPAHQKNWPMFEYQGVLLFLQSIQPLRIILPSPEPSSRSGNHTTMIHGGIKKSSHTTVYYGHTVALSAVKNWCWPWGDVRGGSSMVLINSEYWGFFHTKTNIGSRLVYTYVMGAYTMSAEPPFRLTSMSRYPIVPEKLIFGEWTYSRLDFCLYPMSVEFQEETQIIYVGMGRNEIEGWLVGFNYTSLKRSMRSLESTVKASCEWNQGHPLIETLEYY
jgi:hypothetical protein